MQSNKQKALIYFLWVINVFF